MSSRLPSVPLPRLDALFRMGELLWAERADVRAVHGELTSWGYWCWMMYSGAGEHPALLERLYPMPHAHLAERVIGQTTMPEFLRDGVVDANRIHACLAEAGFDFARPARVLDFGCGCGRLLRVFARHADTLELHGADVDAEAVAWCREELDFASFTALGVDPPTELESESFDAIYAYSVFTHLPEDAHLAWLAELARIVKPGGLVLLTTQGRRIVEHVAFAREQVRELEAEIEIDAVELHADHAATVEGVLRVRASSDELDEWDAADVTLSWVKVAGDWVVETIVVEREGGS